MDLKTGGPLLHGVFCALTGILFVAFFISVAMGPSWWKADGEYHDDSRLGPVLLLVGVAILFQVALGIWVGIDASRRGMNGFLWGALTCFTCVVGLIVYLLSAQSSTGQLRRAGRVAPNQFAGATSACPECGSASRADFLACPHCGIALKSICPECKGPIEAGWRFCPHCKTPLGDGTRSA